MEQFFTEVFMATLVRRYVCKVCNEGSTPMKLKSAHKTIFSHFSIVMLTFFIMFFLVCSKLGTRWLH